MREQKTQRNDLPNPRTRANNTIGVVLWLAGVCTIIVGSLLPGTTVSQLQLPSLQLSDKFLHFSGYLFVAAFPALTLKRCRLGLACALVPLHFDSVQSGQKS